jgi:hypothetical protein
MKRIFLLILSCVSILSAADEIKRRPIVFASDRDINATTLERAFQYYDWVLRNQVLSTSDSLLYAMLEQAIKDSLAANSTGDIQGVTAGTGLSGGGTSGTVTVNADTAALATVYDVVLKQDVADTSAKDATRYWVGQQAYLTAETGDISAVSTNSPLSGGNTTGAITLSVDTTSTKGLATQYDIVGMGDITAINTSAPLSGGSASGAVTLATDTTTTKGLSTQHDLTLERSWSTGQFEAKTALTYMYSAGSLAAAIGDVNNIFLPEEYTDTQTSATMYDLSLYSGTRLQGSGGYVIDWTKATADPGKHLFYLNGKQDIIIDGFKIDMNGYGANDHESDDAILLINCKNITIRNLQILYPSGQGIYVNGCENVLIDNVLIETSDGSPSVGAKAYTCITIGSGSVFGSADSKNIRVVNSELIGGTHSIIDIENSITQTKKIDGVFIDNCKMWKRDRNQAGIQIYGGRVKNITVSNTLVFNAWCGAVITQQDTYASGYVSDILFQNVIFDSCDFGLINRGAQKVTMNNVTAKRCLYDGFNTDAWTEQPRNCYYVDCKAVKNGGYGFKLNGGLNINLVSCHADSNTEDGFNFTGNDVSGGTWYDADQTTMSACEAGYNGGEGVYMGGVNKFLLASGKFHNNTSYGVWADSATTNGVAVFGNQAWSNGTNDYFFHTSITDYVWGINSGSKNRVLNTSLSGNSITSIRDIQHLESPTRDFYIINADQDRDTFFRVNDGGSNSDVIQIDGSESTVNINGPFNLQNLKANPSAGQGLFIRAQNSADADTLIFRYSGGTLKSVILN